LNMPRGSAVTIEQQVLEKFRELPLRSRRKCWILWTLSRARTPQKLLGAAFRGLWEDLNINITEEDIAEASLPPLLYT
jgi:hypothetical protein